MEKTRANPKAGEEKASQRIAVTELLHNMQKQINDQAEVTGKLIPEMFGSLMKRMDKFDEAFMANEPEGDEAVQPIVDLEGNQTQERIDGNMEVDELGDLLNPGADGIFQTIILKLITTW
jgi:hypothetical protein